MFRFIFRLSVGFEHLSVSFTTLDFPGHLLVGGAEVLPM